jgi:hypothetical protein
MWQDLIDAMPDLELLRSVDGGDHRVTRLQLAQTAYVRTPSESSADVPQPDSTFGYDRLIFTPP